MKRKRPLYTAATFILLLLSTGYAQGQEIITKDRIQIGDNILLGPAAAGEQMIEPHLAAHPSDPDHLLAVGWVKSTSDTRQDMDVERCAIFISKDGGQSWRRNDPSGRRCADPWVVLTEEEAILTTLGVHPMLPGSEELQQRNQLLLYFSSDGGESWSDVPQSHGFSHDGPRSVADSAGTVYVVSTQVRRNSQGKLRFPIYVAKSRPGIPYADKTTRLVASNLNLSSDGITVLSDGTLVISYQDYQRPVGGFANRGRKGIIETRREWAVTSTDGGQSFSVPKLITESCYDRANDLVADTSGGTYRDRLYSVCSSDQYQSVLINYSTDRGEEWTDAAPVEAINSSTGGIRIEPHVAVNRDGILGVAWFDSRDNPSDECYTPYVTFSTDGGQNFGDVVRVGEELSCPDPKKAGKFTISRWPEGGDYFGFTTAADGRFHLVWPDARSGKFELYTASISIGSQ